VRENRRERRERREKREKREREREGGREGEYLHTVGGGYMCVI
jgi:hypothetical protein